MLAQIRTALATPRRLALGLAAATTLLAACGGEDGPLPDSAYITWTNSANGVIVKDWNNESFAVRKDNGVIARYFDDLQLIGLSVVGNNVLYNGTVVARVTTAAATDGSQIATITCNSGLRMDITVTGSGNSATWVYVCR